MGEIRPLIILMAATFVAIVTPSSACDRHKIPKQCPTIDPLNTTVHLAHEWDCRKFYKCFEGQPVIQKCPKLSATETLYFNPLRQLCDWPDQAGCATSGAIVMADRKNCSKYRVTINGMTLQHECPQNLYFNDDSKDCVAPIMAFCHHPIFTPDWSDCTKYWKIANGLATLMNCPVGLGFDRRLNTCGRLSEAECPSPLKPCDGIADCTKVADRRNISNPFLNPVKESVSTKCSEGLEFNELSGSCDAPKVNGFNPSQPHQHYDRVQGQKPVDRCHDMIDGTVLANENNCDEYFVCQRGTAIPKKCPEGLYLNNIFRMCVAPEFASCKRPIMVPDKENPAKYREIVGRNVTTEDCPSGFEFSPAKKICTSLRNAGFNQDNQVGGSDIEKIQT